MGWLELDILGFSIIRSVFYIIHISCVKESNYKHIVTYINFLHEPYCIEHNYELAPVYIFHVPLRTSFIRSVHIRDLIC